MIIRAQESDFLRKACMLRLLLITGVYCIGALGCAVQDLQKDQDCIRCALLELYTNQIIDNLVRTANGMPIVQIDYTNATANITMRQTASVNDALATTYSNVLTRAAAATLAVTRTTLNTLTVGATSERSNQVAVTGTPVTTANEVYDAYLEFLTLPGSLQTSCQPPPPGAAHICKKYCDQYYWVPIEYRKEFFSLALATTVQRGKSLLPPDEFFKVTLQEIVEPAPLYPPGTVRLLVKFNKKVPNDSGYMELNFGASNVKLQVAEYVKRGAPRPSETDMLYLAFDSDLMPAQAKSPLDLKLPMEVKLYLRQHHPPVLTTNDLLNRVNFQLQQIQFNQLRGTGP